MNLKVGIVGLPNAGKSTLFNALLKKSPFAEATEGQAGGARIGNYPFTTIDPNVGVVPVPDIRLERLAQIVEREEHMIKPPPIMPAVVEFVDIAGLVKGASEGQGLGNKFLSHIREVNIICHVIRFFPDPTVVHVEGDINPDRDCEIVETELILADLQTLVRQKENGKRQKDESTIKQETIDHLYQTLNKGKLASSLFFTPEEQTAIHDLHLLTMKPIIYVGNVSEHQLAKPPASSLSPIVFICAKTEEELAALSESEQMEYLSSLGVASSGLDKLIQIAYSHLGLISFLTCGPIEARAWTIEKGMKAPAAAGVIHTDFEKKFIRADVIQFKDFVSVGGWKKAREVGKVRSEGKEYVMQDGDVVEFKIGT